MIVVTAWQLQGERPDGSHIEGDTFKTFDEVDYEISKLSMEFPENEYWYECTWGELDDQI